MQILIKCLFALPSPNSRSLLPKKIRHHRANPISLGTVFGAYSEQLNQAFFDAFREEQDTVVVMAAYQLDTSHFDVPAHFMICDYVLQLELMPHVSAAITHAGMNSMGDLLYHEVPFVSIPLGADQFYMAGRAAELGATLVLDAAMLTAQSLREAVHTVQQQPSYEESILRISASFKAAGGYEKAVSEIFRLKAAKGIR